MLSYVISAPEANLALLPTTLVTDSATVINAADKVVVQHDDDTSNAVSASKRNLNFNLNLRNSLTDISIENANSTLTQQQHPPPNPHPMLANLNTNVSSATTAAAMAADNINEHTCLLTNSTPTAALTLTTSDISATGTTTVTATATEPVAASATATTTTTITIMTPAHQMNQCRPPRPNSVIMSYNSTSNYSNGNSSNSNNNNSSSSNSNDKSNRTTSNTINNNMSLGICMGNIDGNTDLFEYDADDLSEEAGTINADSDISDKQQLPSTRQQINKKPKLTKLGGAKTVGLKRVSFGSSKGSMVETLVFETPTPLSEHVEPSFGFQTAVSSLEAPSIKVAPGQLLVYSKLNMDDSGIEVQEESERSIVRVSIYQSIQPQQICPPTRFQDNLDTTLSGYNCNLDYMTTAAITTGQATMLPGYDRQQSTDSGWDNPFRPGGDLSREADEIVSMIRGGKPITPTEDHTIGNGNTQRGSSGDNCNGTAIGESVTKINLTQNLSAHNGTNLHKAQSSAATHGGAVNTAGVGVISSGKMTENNGVTALAQVSKQVVPGPTSASHVIIDEKKNKKKGCCVIQ